MGHGSLAQAVGGQGALSGPEQLRGSVHTQHVVDFTRRSESKASEWLEPQSGRREAKPTRWDDDESRRKSAPQPDYQKLLPATGCSDEVQEPGAGGWRPGGTVQA